MGSDEIVDDDTGVYYDEELPQRHQTSFVHLLSTCGIRMFWMAWEPTFDCSTEAFGVMAEDDAAIGGTAAGNDDVGASVHGGVEDSVGSERPTLTIPPWIEIPWWLPTIGPSCWKLFPISTIAAIQAREPHCSLLDCTRLQNHQRR